MIDIIIPAYNCRATLNRTLDSLLQQSNKNFTVLLVDDCSTQDIYSIVERYKNDLPIKYIRNEINRGVGMTRQRGIDETQAEYLTFLDADDILLPDAVGIWNAEIEKSAPDVIYSPFIYAWFGGCQVKDFFWMCHGKVYKTAFLKQYDIREAEEVKCIDDGYLNWQVFDLAEKVSLLMTPTYVQIYTKGSVTCDREFSKRAISDTMSAKKLAAKQITRFIDTPFDRYEKFYSQVKELLKKDEVEYKKLCRTIVYKSLESLTLDTINN